ncbi:D-aminoacyl-tRNA deacylase [archaeon]
MIGIVYSEKDLAGKGIAAELKAIGCRHELVKITQDIIYPKGIDALGMEFLVFASRHKSSSGTKSLTVHSTGNFGKAEFGGRDKELQATLANAKHNIYLELVGCALDYGVTLEATHHGPTEFKTPLFFVEIGSSEEQWADKKAAEFVAECIARGLDSKKKHPHAIGFGGGHYAPKFSGMEEVAFGHICPKYAAGLLDGGLIQQMVERTVDGVGHAVIDEKGLKGGQKLVIKRALDGLGIDY